MKEFITVFCGLMLSVSLFSKEIPHHRVLSTQELFGYLKPEVERKIPSTSSALAAYFRHQFSERYFYNWQHAEEKFSLYKASYPKQENAHLLRSADHRAKYNDSTHWKLPFYDLNGEEVNAYALRHLARQHKMVDIALAYFYDHKNSDAIDYFTHQVGSLNAALHNGEYESIADGNGIYEAFRSGYRVLNWLQVHALFLSQPDYTDQDQLTTIATLLQHGAHLYKNNQKFKSGNHQTRGLSALAMIAILLRDFEGTNQWYDQAMLLLQEHLEKEVNPDGFQFERSVHYHMSDIDNYFFVYSLIKKSHLPVSEIWTRKLKSLFTTLCKIAYPDLTAPVLQDDTDHPWGEKNEISSTLTLGYLLFQDPECGYFADEHVSEFMYWFIPNDQLATLRSPVKKTPAYGSLAFQETGYYIMREGWDKKDKMMIISAGLDDLKPDHQHGDMLGLQAMALGHVVLPNYQVRYSLKDLALFKNSLTKNVALVDDELQGKQYVSNKGGSGFGKFKQLPKPTVICWESNDDFDFFAGSHNGFEDIGVRYSRQLVYLKDDFWLVKDNFHSTEKHNYKQVWQGHYSLENAPGLLRSSFDDGSGFDIYQLHAVDTVMSSGSRGKQWSVVEKKAIKEYSFVTALKPFENYTFRIDEDKQRPEIGDWKWGNDLLELKGSYDGALYSGQRMVLLHTTEIKNEQAQIKFSQPCDIFVKIGGDKITISSLNTVSVMMNYVSPSGNERLRLMPGKSFVFSR